MDFSPRSEWLALTLASREPTEKVTITSAGTRLSWQDEGVLEITPAALASPPMALVLSAGIHGNETAPIELLDRLLGAIEADQCIPAVRLLMVLGNPDAIRQGVRYVERDLNRLFNGRHHGVEGSEARRAALLEHYVADFLAQDPAGERLHYDLHTAIRGSLITQFALYPGMPGRTHHPRELDRLHCAGMEAVLLQHQVGITFSHYSYATLGAEAMTLELGKARPFGMNQDVDVRALEAVLQALVRQAPLPTPPATPMARFNVSREIIKHQEPFVLHLDDAVENFTPLPTGMVLAEDAEHRVTVTETEARIIFPNPNVAKGLRAGLIIVPA